MSNLLRKYGYDISKSRMIDLNKKYTDGPDNKGGVILIEPEDWADLEFTIRFIAKWYMEQLPSIKEEVRARLVPLEKGLLFQIIKEVTTENHPWIDKTLSVGETYKYASTSMYGTINRVNGLAVQVGNSVVQVNFDYLKLKDQS